MERSPDVVVRVRPLEGDALFTVLNHYAEEWARAHLSDDDERNWLGRSVVLSPAAANEATRLAREAGLKVYVKKTGGNT